MLGALISVNVIYAGEFMRQVVRVEGYLLF